MSETMAILIEKCYYDRRSRRMMCDRKCVNATLDWLGARQQLTGHPSHLICPGKSLPVSKALLSSDQIAVQHL
jgi:hypothetical protein